MAYDGGDMIRIAGSYVASGLIQVDPASVYMQIMNPQGSVATFGYIPAGSGVGSILKDSTGNYYADVLASIGGDWHYRWAGEKTNWAAAEGTFSVNHTVFIL